LPNDEGAVQSAWEAQQARATARGEAVWAGFPLTDSEATAYSGYASAVNGLDTLSNALRDNEKATAGGRLSYDIYRPSVTVLITASATPELRSELQRLASVVPVEFEDARFSTAELREHALGLQQAIQGYRSSSGVVDALRSYGLNVVRVASVPWEQKIEVSLDEGSFKDDQTASVLVKLRRDLPEESTLIGLLTLRSSQPDVEADRNNNPGQAKAGLLTSGAGGCTSNISAKDGSGNYYMMTAGHCYPSTGYNPTGLGSRIVGDNVVYRMDQNSPAIDAAAVRMYVGGSASEYAHFRAPGWSWLAPLTQVSQPPSFNSWICLEGASPSRLDIWGEYRTSCGRYGSLDGNGFGLVNNMDFVCGGDSGGLLRSDGDGHIGYGILHARGGYATTTGNHLIDSNCSNVAIFTRLPNALSQFGLSPVLRTTTGVAATSSLLVQQNSGLCVETVSGSTSSPVVMQLAVCQPIAGQLWAMVPANVDGSGNTYTVVRGNAQNRCMDMNIGAPGQGLSYWDGTQVWQFSCHGGSNQRWRFSDVGSGRLEIRNEYVTAQCLDANIWVPNPGTPMLTWTCSGNAAERFGLG
jgi:hypothetical protein